MELPDKIKVFIHPYNQNYFLLGNSAHELPFLLPEENFCVIRNVGDITRGTVVPVLEMSDKIHLVVDFLGEKIRDVIILVIVHTHKVEYSNLNAYIQKIVDEWNPYTSNVLVALTIAQKNNHPNKIWYDFLWNRAKLYYTNYDSTLLGPETKRLWTSESTSEMFRLSPIEKRQFFPVAPFKQILAPIKSVNPRNYDEVIVPIDYRLEYRKKLLLHLDDSFAYYSDWESKPRKLLESQEPFLKDNNGIKFSGWFPIANDYYNITFVSVYVETLVGALREFGPPRGCLETVHSQSTGITEKTFDPIIKGHFILPFGYSGMVKDIQEIYGFKLPKWIDYSYDEETSIDLRYNLFIKEMYRLSKIPIDDYLKLFEEDKRILEYNRQIFYSRPYDNLSNKIKETTIWKSYHDRTN